MFSLPAGVSLSLLTSLFDSQERVSSLTQPTLEHSEGAGIEQGSPQLTPAADTNASASTSPLKPLIAFLSLLKGSTFQSNQMPAAGTR